MNLTMEYVQEDGSNQNLGEEEDNKLFIEYFRIYLVKNPCSQPMQLRVILCQL